MILLPLREGKFLSRQKKTLIVILKNIYQQYEKGIILTYPLHNYEFRRLIYTISCQLDKIVSRLRF